MAQIEDVFDVISRNASRADFVGPITEAAIQDAEQRLGVRFPPSYRRFVEHYGCGGIGPEEFFGLTEPFISKCPNTAWYTLEVRKYGLPESMIVVQDAGGDIIYCIDTDQTRDDGEAPVIAWIPGLPISEQTLKPVAPTFADFALWRLQTSPGLSDDDGV